LRVASVATAIPPNRYSTEEMLQIFPGTPSQEVEQNILSLGVKFRHLAIKLENFFAQPWREDDQNPVLDLASEAGKLALDRADLNPEDVNYLIATTDANDFLTPGLSSTLVPSLGLSPYVKHANLQGMTCSAFLKALELAEDHLARFPRDKVLVAVSGVNSSWFRSQVKAVRRVVGPQEIRRVGSPEDRSHELKKWVAAMEFFLFGDGAAGIVVDGDGQGPEILGAVHVTNVEPRDYSAGYLRLTFDDHKSCLQILPYLDKRLPDLGLSYTATALERLLGREPQPGFFNSKAEKWLIHTGSRSILDKIASQYGVSNDKLRESYHVLEDYGNLSGASLPFILSRIIGEKTTRPGDRGIMLGFGWGFSLSASMVEF